MLPLNKKASNNIPEASDAVLLHVVPDREAIVADTEERAARAVGEDPAAADTEERAARAATPEDVSLFAKKFANQEEDTTEDTTEDTAARAARAATTEECNSNDYS